MSEKSDFIQGSYGHHFVDGRCEMCLAIALSQYKIDHPDHFGVRSHDIRREFRKEYHEYINSLSVKKCFVIRDGEMDYEIVSLCADHLKDVAYYLAEMS